jgi:hypothetical protein
MWRIMKTPAQFSEKTSVGEFVLMVLIINCLCDFLEKKTPTFLPLLPIIFSCGSFVADACGYSERSPCEQEKHVCIFFPVFSDFFLHRKPLIVNVVNGFKVFYCFFC